MSLYTDIRDGIVARLNAVSNIGTVHNRERLVSDWSTFLAEFTSTISATTQVRGWFVEWVALPEAWNADSSFGEEGEVYAFDVVGIMGVDDSANTAGTFKALVETVKNSLRAENDFGNTGILRASVTVTIPIMQTRMFGSVLCHYAELKVNVRTVQAVAFS